MEKQKLIEKLLIEKVAKDYRVDIDTYAAGMEAMYITNVCLIVRLKCF